MAKLPESIQDDSLAYIINHVFLPPKLPQKAEVDVGAQNSALLQLCVEVADQYQDSVSMEVLEVWGTVLKMLRNFLLLDHPNALDAKAFRREVLRMKGGDILALHIGAQNAGLILQATSTEMIFQSFEVSPLSTEVLKPVGKLRCSYPGPAIAVNLQKIRQKEFLMELSSFLEKMKRDTTLAPDKHSKGASMVSEERETAHPMFITELLFGILRGMGQPAVVRRFEKRIGDEVLWDHARVPWRRSPLWLTVKVALQSVLTTRTNLMEYKVFMIYLMSSILGVAIEQNVASDILFAMNAKLSRRVRKLVTGNANLTDEIQSVIEEARVMGDMCAASLERRWKQTRLIYSRSSSWTPWDMKPSSDTSLSMTRSREYIHWACRWGFFSDVSQRKIFNPREKKRLHQAHWQLPSSEGLTDNFNKAPNSLQKDIALADLEKWVELNLSKWAEDLVDGTVLKYVEERCEELGDLILTYMKYGKQHYSHNPERMSMFYLTLMELWIVMDKLVTQCYPLLADYSPYYFSDGFLNPLLLPEPTQRKRLEHVEAYLQRRKATARIDNIFSGVPATNSFAVRHFDSDPVYAQLRDKILKDAELRQHRKRIELSLKIREQEELKEIAHEMSCEFFTSHRDGTQRHHNRCQKCAKIREADRMRVEVFEWPLPNDDVKSKTVVFELLCPQAFSVWRDITYHILREISSSTAPSVAAQTSKKEEAGKPFEYIENFLELKDYYLSQRNSTEQQVHWASSTKSFLSSHYRFARLPTDLGSVCVQNSLTFGLFDNRSQQWISKDSMSECNIRNECTYRMPDGPYKSLQFSLRYTPLTPNQVIANQGQCPAELPLNEFLAFGLIRSGRRIHWLNMLRELRAKTLTFSSEAVNMLFTLCAWQSGPPGDHSGVYREAHIHLKEKQFRQQLLEEINNMLMNIKTNWQEVVTVRTLITLGIQLLTFSEVGERILTKYAFHKKVADFLRQARAVCLGWVRDLAMTLHDCEDAQETRNLQLRVAQIAAICRETYNVESSYLWLVLETGKDVAELIECATLIHDNLSAPSLETLPLPLRILFERDRRLAHKLEDYIRVLILEGGIRVDLSRVWESYDIDLCTWRQLETPSERWIEGIVELKAESYQIIHYNLLTGRLLVDGRQLGRMPPEYLAHPVYQELLGEKLFDVYPAKTPMDFETRRTIHNHKVTFAMDGDELIIRTEINSETYHLIPKSKLKDDFPAHIIEDYVFWLGLRSRRVELRPRAEAWDQKPYPHITSPLESPLNFMYLRLHQYEHLIDVRSDTAKMIHSVLRPLEYDSHIQVTVRQTLNPQQQSWVNVVNVALPRLNLNFFINNERELECRQFPRMIVDRKQHLDTFIGLDSKLVFRQGNVRSVMVPYGKVTFRSNEENHVGVDISTKPKGFARVKYHLYTIDDILGRLVGNGSLANHLFKVYLHAVTSSCMPDPLTGRTGTEEALALLRSAATWSFQRLESEGVEAEILRLISGLSPQRAFYPKHLRRMQQITWNALSPLSQHESFDLIVQDVFSYAASLRIFTDGNVEQKYHKAASETHLARRAAFRNTTLRRDEFIHSAEILPTQADLQYVSRDIQITDEEAKVHYVAQLVESWPRQLTVCSDLMEHFIQWDIIGADRIELGYDEKLLDINIADVWFHLQESLIYSLREDDMYSIMFTFATLAFKGQRGAGLPLPLIGTLLAFASDPGLSNTELPGNLFYHLSAGFEPDEQLLFNIIKENVVDFAESEAADLPALVLETKDELDLRRSKVYAANVEDEVSRFIHALISQWPCDHHLKMPFQYKFPLIKVDDVELAIGPLFSTWHSNMMFKEYVGELQGKLDRINNSTSQPIPLQHYSFMRSNRLDPPLRNPSTLYEELFHRQSPRLSLSDTVGALDLPKRNIPPNHQSQAQPHSNQVTQSLQRLITHFSGKTPKGDTSSFFQQYAADLEKSVVALERSQPKSTTTDLPNWELKSKVREYKKSCDEYLQAVSNDIQEALTPYDEGWMTYRAGLWPQLCRRAILQRLAAPTFAKLPEGWQKLMITYGTAITRLQRAERLLRLAESLSAHGSRSDFIKELENSGHQGWNPLEKPDWLLMEIENNVLIRPVQAEVAQTMIAPPEEKNTIMQLLMGEGKTSIIVPIVATSLANAGKLVRVVILKPLCGQMFQTLVQRLGGLVNRRLYYMPFSRKLNLSSIQVQDIHKMLVQCREMGGVLVVQPEHILSFKLLGLERLYNAQNEELCLKNRQEAQEQMLLAQLLIDMQRWLKNHARDILDESDEILNTRHELIYTIGLSKPIEHHPQRWLVVQEVLSLMGMVLKEMARDPTAFEIELSPESEKGGFDSIRILDIGKGRRLLEEVAKRILDSQLPLISFRHWTQERRVLALKFITIDRLKQEEISDSTTGDSDLDRTLLLLRGLIAHKILLFTLHEKRWKVDYGLDLKRSKLAVPYRAKDCPSGQSEFSHPDVAITLTCLSYYYGGLTADQLEIAFRILLKTDNPTLEYEKWWNVMTTSENWELKHLNAINLEDSKQWSDKIVPMFRFNKAAVDFYLSHVVFPSEAKEFQHKLSSSGWDIAEQKKNPTTGFSGTNDNRYLLPLSIKQHDTEQQRNTNASVLSYLLERGNGYLPVKKDDDTRLGTFELLKRLTELKKSGDKVRVLLDVGAQVLQLNNEQVASYWLKLATDVRAAVYFNDDDELTVLTRDGVREPVITSAFADRLEDCVVYLDEAHTRGTDLKLPPICNAAVTLGPNLTKDRLVQACMRMRKLGSGHSVVFCGPPEIDRDLQDLAQADGRRNIQVSDVIHWSMKQTCINTRKLVPIWAKQGISYRQRQIATKGIATATTFPQDLLENEAKSLEQHYGLERSQSMLLGFSELTNDSTIKKIVDKCKSFGVKSSAGAPMLEEQERELCHEIESERKVQLPPPADALKHHVAAQLREFVETGKLPPLRSRYEVFLPAFEILCHTTAAEHFERTAWPQNLLVTKDFASTVVKKKNTGIDNYLMPVNWILSSTLEPKMLVILNPWEANGLITKIRQSKTIMLHMYSPRTTKAGPSYDTLDYYTLPHVSSRIPPSFVPTASLPRVFIPHSSAVDLLNLFSGQLYFHDYASYERVCGFLGLCFKSVSAMDLAKKIVISPDGYVKSRDDRNTLGMPESPFERNPLPLLRILVGLRRKGQSYMATHVGCMLHGRQLRVEDVELVDEVGTGELD